MITHSDVKYLNEKYVKNLIKIIKLNFQKMHYFFRTCAEKSKNDKVVFISRWIQQRFFTSFKNANLSSTIIIPHGINKNIKISIPVYRSKKKYFS